jgi:hypothetical protein
MPTDAPLDSPAGVGSRQVPNLFEPLVRALFSARPETLVAFVAAVHRSLTDAESPVAAWAAFAEELELARLERARWQCSRRAAARRARIRRLGGLCLGFSRFFFFFFDLDFGFIP